MTNKIDVCSMSTSAILGLALMYYKSFLPPPPSGLNNHCKQNGMKCYYVLTHENILLKHNMQEMCNWKRLNIEEIYPMIVEYVFAIVEHIFTLVKYNLI